MLTSSWRLDPRSESGQSITLFAIFLPLILVILALVVDGSLAFVQKQSAQNAADAAALAAAQDVTGSSCTNCGVDAANYLRQNGVNPGVGSGQSLPLCSVSQPPCYSWPYVDGAVSHTDEVAVSVRPTYKNIFGTMLAKFGLVGDPSQASASAVGGLGPGNAPPVTFAALNSSSDNHTLLIKAGGDLTVGSDIWVNSSNQPQDAFDVFNGGSIHAPQINVVGGWETHDGSTVWVGGSQCSLQNSASYFESWATTTQTGCPTIGHTPLVDPFAGAIVAPSLVSSGVSSCSQLTPCYNTVEYSPPQYANGSIAAGDSSFLVRGTAIQQGDYISVDGERMLVTGVPSSGSGSETVQVSRGTSVLGTAAADHTVPQVAVAAEQRADGVATITTATPHGLAIGDQVVVNIPGDTNGFNGIHTVTAIPDDDDAAPDEFSFTDGQSGLANVGSASIVGVSRTNGVDMIETSAPHGLQVGDPVIVNIKTGDTSFSTDETDDATVLSVPSPTTFTYLDPNAGTPQAGPDVGGPSATIASVARIGNLATITTATNPGLSAGGQANVTFSPDSSFNATPATINASSSGPGPGATITYANSGPNDKPALVSGGHKVSSASRSSGTTTLTVDNVSNVSVGGYIAVGISDSTFDGVFQVTAYVSNGPNSSISYANPGADVTNKLFGGGSDQWTLATPISTIAQTNGTATVTSATNPNLNVGQYVTLGGTGNSSLDGTFQVTSVNPPTNTFTYTNPNAATASATTGGFAQVTPGASVAGSNCAANACTIAGIFAAATGTAIGPAKDVSSLNGTVTGPLFEVFLIPSTAQVPGGSAGSPAEYSVPSSTRSTQLNPGTYYGGICIGNPQGVRCGNQVGGSCSTSSSAGPTVLLNPGVYIIAGGGFFVCGNANVTGNGVMIYNTVDSASRSTAAALDQVALNTNGNVTLTAPTTGEYAGMTIYQGPDPAVSSSSPQNLELSSSKCSGDGRQTAQTDIDLIHAGTNGLNGLSGTIYAPANNALFTDQLNGTANLAVLAGCIYINGASATFNFNASSGLFGRAPGLIH